MNYSAYAVRRTDSDEYLIHYGISGQKWGVRRFQTEGGKLTEEGKERYGDKKDRGDKGLIKKWTLGSEGGEYAIAKWRERRHKKNLAKAKESGNQKKINKYQSKLDAQSAANANLDAYRRHARTSTLLLQNAGVLPIVGTPYRHARARGAGKVRSIMEALPTALNIPLRMAGDKKAYGKYIVFSAPGENEYYANGISNE